MITIDDNERYDVRKYTGPRFHKQEFLNLSRAAVETKLRRQGYRVEFI
ncbi:MAG TPA: hypothetical protein VI756_25825 [Blastocatellia bacterium]